VEGAPPVPMVVRNLVVVMTGTPRNSGPPEIGTYPMADARQVPQDAVIKVFFSKPVDALDGHDFILSDSRGKQVPARIDQIGAGTWGLFADQVLLHAGETYTARLKAGVCDLFHNCTSNDLSWRFTTAKEAAQAAGDTNIPMGFAVPHQNANRNAVAALTRRAHGTRTDRSH